MGIQVAGLYLAAGQSRRMGVPKLAIPFRDKGLLGGFAFEQAMVSGLDQVIVVTREEGLPDWLPASYHRASSQASRRCSFVVAENADRGMACSLQAGLHAAVNTGPAKAVVVVLADQPFIHAEMINRLIDKFKSDTSLDYVASGDRGVAKPPILLAASMFKAVRQLQGDEGARKLLLKAEFRGLALEEQDSRLFADMDTVEDIERFSNF